VRKQNRCSNLDQRPHPPRPGDFGRAQHHLHLPAIAALRHQRKCYPCLRTPVTDVSGLYRAWGVSPQASNKLPATAARQRRPDTRPAPTELHPPARNPFASPRPTLPPPPVTKNTKSAKTKSMFESGSPATDTSRHARPNTKVQKRTPRAALPRAKITP
jgi:hypothetical protein